MAKRKSDTQTVAEFNRDSATVLEELKRSRRPVVLTVNGEAAAVLIGPDDYQELLAQAGAAEEEAEMREFLSRSMADIDAGRTHDAFEAMDALAAKYNLPKPS